MSGVQALTWTWFFAVVGASTIGCLMGRYIWEAVHRLWPRGGKKGDDA